MRNIIIMTQDCLQSYCNIRSSFFVISSWIPSMAACKRSLFAFLRQILGAMRKKTWLRRRALLAFGENDVEPAYTVGYIRIYSRCKHAFLVGSRNKSTQLQKCGLCWRLTHDWMVEEQTIIKSCSTDKFSRDSKTIEIRVQFTNTNESGCVVFAIFCTLCSTINDQQLFQRLPLGQTCVLFRHGRQTVN